MNGGTILPEILPEFLPEFLPLVQCLAALVLEFGKSLWRATLPVLPVLPILWPESWPESWPMAGWR
ncbi:MAG: hypothetical protein ACXVDA_10600 [Ktedonobacterales bacterium]